MKKYQMRKYCHDWLYYLVVVLFLLFTLGPIAYAFLISITPESEILSTTTRLMPDTITWANYQELFDRSSQAYETIASGLRNSLITAALSVVIGLPVSVLTAYAFTLYQFKFKKLILYFILVTIVIPVFTTIIPIYAMFAQWRLLDNLVWTSVIYVSAFIPLNTWIIMNYMQALPKELWEAARIDGCNGWQTFWHIILPVSYPIIVTSILLIFLMSWSQYQIPLILTSSQANKVVTLVLSEFMTRDTISYGMIAASGLLSIVPPVIVAVVFRNFLISGLTAGSVKG